MGLSPSLRRAFAGRMLFFLAIQILGNACLQKIGYLSNSSKPLSPVSPQSRCNNTEFPGKKSTMYESIHASLTGMEGYDTRMGRVCAHLRAQDAWNTPKADRYRER